MKQFNAKLSAKLDHAVYMSEEGGGLWSLVKRFLEWLIFGGGK